MGIILHSVKSSLVNTQSLTSASYISFQKCSNISLTNSGLIFSVDAAISASIHANWMVPSVQSLSRVRLFLTPWIAACQAPLSSTVSWSLLKFMSIELMMISNHLILCHALLLLSSVFPTIRVFSNASALRIRWPKYWCFSFNHTFQ